MKNLQIDIYNHMLNDYYFDLDFIKEIFSNKDFITVVNNYEDFAYDYDLDYIVSLILTELNY